MYTSRDGAQLIIILWMQPLLHLLLSLAYGALLCLGSTKDKPHPHNGHLIPFDGRHISYNITKEQSLRLATGQPVSALRSIIILSIPMQLISPEFLSGR